MAGKARLHREIVAAVHVGHRIIFRRSATRICRNSSAGRTVTIRALHACGRVYSVVEHHVLRQFGVVPPGVCRSGGERRIQLLDSGIFSERQAVAIHAVRLRRQVRLRPGCGTRMAVTAIEPDVLPVERMQKNNRIRATRIRAHAHRSGLLTKQKIRQKESEDNGKNEPRPLERGYS